MISSIFTILDTLLRGRDWFPSIVRTMSSISRFVTPYLHGLEPSCGSTVIWHTNYVHLRVSASAFSSAHKHTLIYEREHEYGAMHVCVFLSGLSLIVPVEKKKKKLQMLYEVKMEQLNTHGGGESCNVNKNRLPTMDLTAWLKKRKCEERIYPYCTMWCLNKNPQCKVSCFIHCVWS